MDLGSQFFKDKGEQWQRYHLQRLRDEAVIQELNGHHDLAERIVAKIKQTLKDWGAE